MFKLQLIICSYRYSRFPLAVYNNISEESELIHQWPLLRWRVTPGSARSAHRRALLLSG